MVGSFAASKLAGNSRLRQRLRPMPKFGPWLTGENPRHAEVARRRRFEAGVTRRLLGCGRGHSIGGTRSRRSPSWARFAPSARCRPGRRDVTAALASVAGCEEKSPKRAPEALAPNDSASMIRPNEIESQSRFTGYTPCRRLVQRTTRCCDPPWDPSGHRGTRPSSLGNAGTIH